MNVLYRRIRGVPDQSVLPQRALAAEVTDHHQTGRDADAHRERFRNERLKPRNRGNDIERRPHRSLGIVFVRAGIAEIRQYFIAPEITEDRHSLARYGRRRRDRRSCCMRWWLIPHHSLC